MKTKEDLSVDYANRNSQILIEDFTKVRKAYIAGWEARDPEVRRLQETIDELKGAIVKHTVKLVRIGCSND